MHNKPVIDLIWCNDSEPGLWEFGEIINIGYSVEKLQKKVFSIVEKSRAEYLFFWAIENKNLPTNFFRDLPNGIIDVFHAGLKLGTRGQPEFINYVNPNWMLNADSTNDIASSSWRLSLRCCLIKTEVIKQLGFLNKNYHSVDIAALDFGYRLIRNGVFIRYEPGLIQEAIQKEELNINLEDQFKFILYNHGRKWFYWAGFRAVLSGKENLFNVFRYIYKLKNEKIGKQPVFRRQKITSRPDLTQLSVSIIIPTIHRYPYLRVLLAQLRNQTIKPLEIMILDQTPLGYRDFDIKEEFSDLPIKYYYLDIPGQCSSRNLGIQKSKGEYLLFLDDDVEIYPSFIQEHLNNLEQYNGNVSSGLVHKNGQTKQPYNFSFLRISNVFPAGNTFIRKNILINAGLFDLAYDKGQRADGDLGMRIYLSGQLMVLDPQIDLIHHHAPQGGLRTHKARVNTYAASRKSINNRLLPSVWDLYLAKRYFTKHQVNEKLWISILGTFSHHGSGFEKTLKIVLSLIMLPFSIIELRKRNHAAEKMLLEFPQIPELKK